MRGLLLVIPCWQLVFTVQCATTSVARCSRYVEEGDTLTCTCTPGDCTNSQVTVTWLNQSPASDTLVQTNVRREDNGTQFTCQMVCDGETSTVTYVLQVGYGPSEKNVFIVGNSTLITDGNRELNLTCVAREVNPVPVYSWLDPLCLDSQGSTCSFRPQIPWDDGQTLICRVTDDFRVTPQAVVKEVIVHLKYPPFDTPVISGYTPGQIVKTGDTLTCTVTGGKPLVDHVNFYCSDHVHTDQQHTTQGTSVSSTLTIDVTNVTKETENVTCHCSGYWAPEDDLYTLNTNVTFYTEYPPYIVDFTANGNYSETLTLNEGDHVTVTLQCSAYGRPAPRVYLMKNGTEEIASNGVPDKLSFTQVVPYTLGLAQCEHSGNYTVFVKDTQTDSHQRTIRLQVNCAPRLPKNVSSNMDRCPPAISKNGFSLLVVANPSPHNVTVEYLGVTRDKDIMAFLSINQRPISLCETRIEVRVTDFTELPDGDYRLSVSNTLGSFNCSFPRMKKHDPLSAGAIVGGTVAALVVIIIIIVVIACCCRGKRKGPDKQNLHTKHNEGVVNPKFVEDGSGSGSNHDNDSGIEMNGGSSPLEMSPRQSDGAGYASLSDYPPSGQHSGEFRKKSGRAAAYEVTRITSTGKVNIKPAAPQPNAYQDPWDIKKYAKGDNTQGTPATAQGNKGDVTSSSGDAAASESPVQNTSSSGDGTDNYDHFQRDGHDPTSTSQGPDVPYSHIGNY